MKTRIHPILLLASAGMLLSWLFVLPHFLSLCLGEQRFPSAAGLGTFGLAFGITALSRGAGLRVIWSLVFSTAGFVLAGCFLLHASFHPAEPFWDPAWLSAFFKTPHTPLAWVRIVLIVIWTGLFWAGGGVFARRPADYAVLRYRFDLGLALFCLVFFIKFLVAMKGGTLPSENTSLYLLCVFFVCALISFGLAGEQGPIHKDFLAPYRGTAVILSFAALVVFAGAGLMLALLPVLTSAADAGLAGLQTILAPLVPVLVSLLRFIFTPKDRGAELNAPPQGSGEHMPGLAAPETSWWVDALLMGFAGVLVLLLGFLLLFCLSLAAGYLLKWLLSKTPPAETARPELRSILLWLQGLSCFLDGCWNRVLSIRKKRHSAIFLYAALAGWGRRSGLKRSASETPYEYGERLSASFPGQAEHFQAIIRAFTLECYAQRTPLRSQTEAAWRAWRRLCRPRLWWSRFRKRLLKTKDVAHDKTMV